jgi:hypothetical protein
MRLNKKLTRQWPEVRKRLVELVKTRAEKAGPDLRERIAATNADLAARGIDIDIADLNDLAHLARMIRMDPGPMTAAEIVEWAVAWDDAERHKALLAAAAQKAVAANEARPDVLPPQAPKTRAAARVAELRAVYTPWKDITETLNREYPRPGKRWTREAARGLIRPRE